MNVYTSEQAIEWLRGEARYGSLANNTATNSKKYPPEWFRQWKYADAIEAKIAALTAQVKKLEGKINE